MASKRPVAPDTPVRTFPTPNIDDLVVLVDVDSRLPGYKPLEYGTLHPDQTRFPGAKLVYQEPIDGSDQFIRRIYATDRRNQDSYNYAIKYSGGSQEHPIYIRTYVEPRDGYAPLPDGTPDPLNPGAFIVEEETAPVEGELNSLYFRVSRVFETLPGPVLTSFETNDAGQKVTVTTQRKSSSGYALPQASATSSPSAQAEDTGVVTEQIRSVPSVFARKQYSAERPDPLPAKFRAAVPDVETSEIVEGTAGQPTLDVPQELSASETQETVFLKRISRRLRPDPDYPVTFEETTRTNTGQLATTISTLDEGLQTADTGPLVESSEVTDLGDGRSIKVTTEVDQVFEQPSFTRSKEDLTPQKFRAALSETVEERTLPGTATMPVSLAGNEISKTEEQLTLDRKRVRTQERNITTSDPLVEKVLTPEGQLATRTLTLSDDPQTVQPSATLIQGEIEQLGDGRSVKTEVVVPSVFDERRAAKERPDLVPQEFRGAVPTETTETVAEGATADMPTLGAGELSRAVQRVTAQKVRTSVVSRPTANLPVSLTPDDILVDNDGVTVTRVKTLASGTQTLSVSATQSGSVESLGDGLTVKTQDTKAEVFSGAVYTKTKDDLTPQKFRAAVAEEIVESTTAGTASMPASLDSDEFEKSEQQVSKFTKRTRTRLRNTATAPELSGEVYTSDLGGGLAIVTETYGPNVAIDPGYGTVSAEKEELGDGNFVTRQVVLTEPPELTGQVYDDQLDVVFPFVQKVVPAETPGIGDPRAEIQPQNVYHSVRRELDVDAFRALAFAQHWKVPSYVDVRLPDVLESAEVIFAESVSSGGANATGSSWSVSASGSRTVVGDVRTTIRNGYSGPVPATRHIFFIDKDDATNEAILEKVEAENWPAIFTRPETITVAGGAITKQEAKSATLPTENFIGSSSNSTSYSADVRVSIVTIPPTLHGSVTVTQAPTVQIASFNNITGNQITVSAPNLSGQFTPSTLSATYPPSFPTGDFLASIDTESYKYGLVRITAVVAHITATYVNGTPPA